MIVLINVSLRLSKFKLVISRDREKVSGPIGGLMAGIVGGTTSFVGPLLVLYLSSLKNFSKDDFVKAIALLYLVGFIPMYGGLVALGAFSWGQLIGSVAICLPMLAGIWMGERARSIVSESLFEKGVMITLSLIAISLIYRSTESMLEAF
jgi:uncharacterized membrane protein YfcA